jgi:hypothetical protein
MILSNELRIGNLVYNRHGEIHEVRENTFQLFRYPTMDGDPAKLKGIPLTPEILEKAGFGINYLTTGAWNAQKGLYFLLSNFEFHIQKSYYENQFIAVKNIKHLHQLQNLYFALTGEELQIDL